MNQKGRTLVEMLAVVGILGIISVSGIVGSRWLFSFHSINSTVTDIEETAHRAKDLFDLSCDVLNMGTTNLCSEGIFPQGCTDSFPNNPWNTLVSITPIMSNNGENCLSFAINYNEVPKQACDNLCTNLAHNFRITKKPRDTESLCHYGTNSAGEEQLINKCTNNTSMSFEPLY